MHTQLKALMLAALAGAAQAAMGAERGTVGVGVMQLLDPRAPEQRGALVVLDVTPDGSAAKAGVQVGDLITAIDGKPLRGRALDEISKAELHGPPGATLALSLFRVSTQAQLEAKVERVAYRPMENAATDGFHYLSPGAWHAERHDLPPQWAPQLPYKGLLDLRFAPDFNDPKSPEYASYFFVWWLEGEPRIDANQLERDLVTYYGGLSASMAAVTGSKAAPGKQSASFRSAGEGRFEGLVTSFDPEGKVEPHHGEVKVLRCPSQQHTALLFSISPQARGNPIWKELDAIRDSFTCRA